MESIQHIAVILDGNRRFARNNKDKLYNGHKAGSETLKNFLLWCDEFGIREVTLYAFSMQNFNRSEQEKKYLFRLFDDYITKSIKTKEFENRKVNVRFIGRIDLFPKTLKEKMIMLMESTKGFRDKKLNFAMAYGGREEIIDAANALLDNKSKSNDFSHVSESEFSKYLYMNSDPDIVIRTGDAIRTSNFLPWQTIYSEWFFLKKMWPEFTKQDLLSIIEEFNNRERRFGR